MCSTANLPCAVARASWAVNNQALALLCRDLLLFRPASGDPVAASQWRKRDRYGMTSCVPTLPKRLIAS